MKANRSALAENAGNDSGVTVIVGAILLAGILLASLLTVRMGFVPIWEEDAEADHMRTLSAQMSDIKLIADRQLENRSLTPVGAPVTLGRAPSSVFSPATLPGNLQFQPGTAGIEMSSKRFVRQVASANDDLPGTDEGWEEIPATKQPVYDVSSFRLKLGEWGKGHQEENVVITITQPLSGRDQWVGNVTVHQVDDNPNDELYVTVTKPAADPIDPDTVLYNNPEPSHNSERISPYWLNILDPDYFVDRLIAKAVKPVVIALQADGFVNGDTGETPEVAMFARLTPGEDDPFVGGGGEEFIDFAPNPFVGGSLYLDPANTYFIEQRYVFENGALILEQNDGATFRVPPLVDVTSPTDKTMVTFNIPTLTGDVATVNSDAGATVSMVSESQVYLIGDASNLTLEITTEYPDLWADLWDAKLRGADLETSLGHYKVSKTPNKVTVEIWGTDADTSSTELDLFLTIRQATVSVEVAS